MVKYCGWNSGIHWINESYVYYIQYYNSKQLKEDNPEEALAGFAKVVELETPAAEWGFKALKQTIKLTFRLGRHEEMMKNYRTLLTYIKNAVPRNYSEKSINNLMDLIATGQQVRG